jgi:hypothetical protein
MGELLLTPVTRQAIQGLVKRAHGHRLSHATLALRKVVPEEHRLVVPHGFSIYLDTGYYQPQQLHLHLAVQGPGKWPRMSEVRTLMRMVGFKGKLEEVTSWPDRSQPRHVVHLLEPIHAQ